MKHIAWGKGFFRLWVFLSALWMLLTVALAWKSIWTLEGNAHIVVAGVNSDEVYDAYEPWIRYKYDDLVEKKAYDHFSIDEFPGTSFYVDSGIQKSEMKRRMARAISTIKNRTSEEISSKRWNGLHFLLLFALLPPLAVLVLGLALFWVLRGFRQTHASNFSKMDRYPSGRE